MEKKILICEICSKDITFLKPCYHKGRLLCEFCYISEKFKNSSFNLLKKKLKEVKEKIERKKLYAEKKEFLKKQRQKNLQKIKMKKISKYVKKKPMKKFCPHCNKIFFYTSTRKLFCSKTCAGASYAKKRANQKIFKENQL